MNILHITASPRGAESFSNRLSGQIVDRLAAEETGARIVRRDLAGQPLPPVDVDYAQALTGRAPGHNDGSLKLSDELIAELQSADAVVIGTPMYNYTVPAALKNWIDHVLRIGRTFTASAAGKAGSLHDRPVFIAVAAGGIYLGETAMQADFVTPYLQAALGTMGLKQLHFIALQGTVRNTEAVAAAWHEAVASLDFLMEQTA